MSLECLRCTTLTSNTPIHKQTDEEEEEDDGPTHTRSKICSFNLHILLFMNVTERNYLKYVRVKRICLYYWYSNSIKDCSFLIISVK